MSARCQGVARTGGFRRLQSPPAAEDRQPSEQHPLGVVEQSMAPLHGRQERLLASGVVRWPPTSSRNRSSSRAAICSTDSNATRAVASSNASGMRPVADTPVLWRALSGRQRESRLDGPGTLEEQLGGRASRHALRRVR